MAFIALHSINGEPVTVNTDNIAYINYQPDYSIINFNFFDGDSEDSFGFCVMEKQDELLKIIEKAVGKIIC